MYRCILDNSLLKRGLNLKSLVSVFIVVETISFLFYFTQIYFQYNVANILSSVITTVLITFYLFNKSRNSSGSDSLSITNLSLLLSFVSWSIAEFLYGYFNGFLGVDTYPHVADGFYLIGYIFLVVFLYSINKLYKIELGITISSLVTFSLFSFYLLYISIFIFEIYTFDGNIIALVLLFAYPMFDVFILLGAVIYYIRGREISLNKEYYFWIFIALFGFFFLIADLTFGLGDLFRIVDDSKSFDLFFNIGYACFGIAILVRLYYDGHQNNTPKFPF
jgi:hypothetical protein